MEAYRRTDVVRKSHRTCHILIKMFESSGSNHGYDCVAEFEQSNCCCLILTDNGDDAHRLCVEMME